jgi:TorA maturation chaperone TorD
LLLSKNELAKLLKDRETIYSFLGRMCEKEIDEKLLDNLLACKEILKDNSIVKSDSSDVKNGFEELHSYLAVLSGEREKLSKAVLELAVDYADLFLGVGHFRNKGEGIPHPSESTYLGGYLYGDVVEKIFEAYLEEGLVKSPDFNEPEDHIALELYFMAHLCRKANTCLESGTYQDLLKCLKTQKAFLDEHLLKWAPRLAEDIIRYANTIFYRAVGKIMKGFLKIEEENVGRLVEQAKSLL